MKKQDLINIFSFFGTLIGGALLVYVIVGFCILCPKHLTYDMIKTLNLIPIGIIGVTLFIPAAILSINKQRQLISVKNAQEIVDSLQSQIKSEVDIARLYASFYRVAKIIREAKDADSLIKSQLELEGIISWEFMRSSTPNYNPLQQELEKELKEECIKLWKTTFKKEDS